MINGYDEHEADKIKEFMAAKEKREKTHPTPAEIYTLLLEIKDELKKLKT